MDIILDGQLMTSRAALHDLLVEKLSLPDYYGRNLDALYDLLSSRPQRVDLTVVHAESMLESLGSYGKSFLRTLQDAANDNSSVNLKISNEIIENNT